MTTKTLTLGVPGIQDGLSRHAGKLVLLSDMLAIFVASLIAMEVVAALQAPDGTHAELMPQWMLQLYLFGAAICSCFAFKGHYVERQLFATEAVAIITITLVAALLDGCLQQALHRQPSVLWLGTAWTLLALLLIASRLAIKYALFHIGPWRCPVTVVGTGSAVKAARQALGQDRYVGHVVTEAVILDGTDVPEERLAAAVSDRRCRYVVIALDNQESTAALAIARFVDEQLDVPYGIIPDLREIPKKNLKLRKLFGQDMVVLDNHRGPQLSAAPIMKRAFDMIAACCLLLFVAPLMLVIGLLIRLDGGPALYGSPRIGRDGRVFRAMKFRSMVPKADEVLRRLLETDPVLRAEWEAGYKLKHDPRITAIGRFIRCTSIDELPQLINVLKGEMSLVGPRPLLLDERPKYPGRELKLYETVTPGLTGLWQVSGRNDLDYARRVELNNWYIKNWSPWVDVVILIKTLFVVIRRSGAS